MAASSSKQLRLRLMNRVVAPAMVRETPGDTLTARERLIAALVEGPRTVAQLARAFGLAQPTVLEQTRRALRDGLIVEVEAPAERRRFAAERYYALAVPVIRQPDRDLLGAAFRAAARELAGALLENQGDLQAAFAMTQLARDGWQFDDLWPYFSDTICQLALESAVGFVESHATQRPLHGLAWVEDGVEPWIAPADECEEELA